VASIRAQEEISRRIDGDFHAALADRLGELTGRSA
jgi:hypothetical protein